MNCNYIIFSKLYLIVPLFLFISISFKGAVVPLGQTIENPAPHVEQNGLFSKSRAVNWNEYIVYNESQVALRYIVQFR